LAARRLSAALSELDPARPAPHLNKESWFRREPQGGFVHQRGSLQRMGGPLVTQEGRRHAVQLTVNQVQERRFGSGRRAFFGIPQRVRRAGLIDSDTNVMNVTTG